MTEIYIYDDITGERFSKLIDFVIKRSDSVSVSRLYSGYLKEAEFNQIQEAYKEYIVKEDAKRRDNYRNNLNEYQSRLNSTFHFNNDQEAYSYFDELLEQDLTFFEELRYDSFSKEPENKFTCQSHEFIRAEYTRVTPVTINPVSEMCFF